MPLDTTNFHPQGPVKSVDLLQFYNLFTGLMNDQPVAFSNSVTIGGNQGLTTVPLRVYGAIGQNTNLIDLYADKNQAQPGFGFSAVGRFAWGPGGVSPQDTFMSRIATQNGHSSDTPGLLITPTLEVTGTISALGYAYTNQASITAPAGTPKLLVIDQDLTVNRDVSVLRDVTIGRDLSVTRRAAIGTALDPRAGLAIKPPQGQLVGTTQFGVYANPVFGTDATVGMYGGYFQASSPAASMTVTEQAAIIATSNQRGAGSTVTNSYGLLIQTQGAGTNNYGLWVNSPGGGSGNNYAIVIDSVTNRIRTPANAPGNLSVESTALLNLCADGTNLAGNAYWDGTNWQRFSTSKSMCIWGLNDQGLSYYAASAGANPVSYSVRLTIDTTPTMIFGYTGSIRMRDSGQVARYVLSLGGTGATQLNTTPAGLQIVNAANNTYLMSMDDGGNTQFNAQVLAVGNILAGGIVNNFAPGALTLNINSQFLAGKNNAGAYCPILCCTGDGYNAFYCGPAGILFTNSTNTVRIGILDNAGALQLNSALFLNTTRSINGGSITLNSNNSQGNVQILAENGLLYFWLSHPTAQAYIQNSNGTAWRPINASAFTVNSTVKSKRNLVALDQSSALEHVLDARVRPLSFNRNDEADIRRLGFAAEDMRTVIPEAVSLDRQGDPEGIDYGSLVPVLWGAVRALSARIDTLEGRAA